jgi:predicted outer membrane protein
MAVTRTLVAVIAIALVAGCDDDDTLDSEVIQTADAGAAQGAALADQAAGELTGDQYSTVIGKTASILFVLNDNEVKAADFTIDVLSGGDIEDYAEEIATDHSDANVVLDDVVRGYGAAYLPSSTADQLAAAGSAALAELRGTPPTDVAFKFTQIMVTQHSAALVILDELAAQVGPGAMGDYIADTRAMVDAHLGEGEFLLDDFY